MFTIITRKRPGRAPLGVVGAALSLILLFAMPASATPTSAAQRAHDEIPAPPQMRSLYPMLGFFKCADTPPPGVEAKDLLVTNTKGLGGHYLDSLVVIPGVVRGRSTMGWDPVNGEYFTFYADDWGTSGLAQAPGWVDGHLTFKGWTIQPFTPDPSGHSPGVRIDGESVYQILGPRRYIDTVTSTLPDGRSVQHIYDCRRQ